MKRVARTFFWFELVEEDGIVCAVCDIFAEVVYTEDRRNKWVLVGV